MDKQLNDSEKEIIKLKTELYNANRINRNLLDLLDKKNGEISYLKRKSREGQ